MRSKSDAGDLPLRAISFQRCVAGFPSIAHFSWISAARRRFPSTDDQTWLPVQVLANDEECLLWPVAALDERHGQLVEGPVQHSVEHFWLAELCGGDVSSQARVERIKVKLVEPGILDLAVDCHS